MDVLTALSKAADITKPGARDQLPVGSVVLTVTALVAAGAPARVPTVARLVSTVKGLGVIGLIVLIVSIVAASILLEPLLTSISTVLYATKSIRGFRWLMLRLRRHHIQRFDQLRFGEGARAEIELRRAEVSGEALDPKERLSLDDIATRAAIALRRYPLSKDHVVATLLGNVLRAAETTAGERYGLDTVTVFPRLEPLLSDETGRGVAKHRDDLRFAVRLASALIIGAVASALILLPIVRLPQMNWPDVIWFSVPVASALLAWASYYNAVLAAIQYGEALAVAFDLNRFALYEALRLEMPSTTMEERRMANAITRALLGGSVQELAYYKQD